MKFFINIKMINCKVFNLNDINKKNIQIIVDTINKNSDIIIVKYFFNIKQKNKVITLNQNYNNTFSYTLKTKKDDFSLHQTYLGTILRNGLTIIENEITNESKIVKRGLPYIYEFTEIKRNNSKSFKDELFSFLSDLFQFNQVKTLFIYQNKILSEHWFQISFDMKFKIWIISHNKLETIIFEKKEELEQLKDENKISNIIYEIGNLWLEEISKIQNELLLCFFQLLSSSTLIGFYIGDPESILTKDDNKYLSFSYIVQNQENLNNFSLSRERTESIFTKYNLNYEKSIKRKENIRSFVEAKIDIINLYNEISYNYINFELSGSILIIQSEDKIISAFKIFNREMQVINYMKNKIKTIGSNKDLIINNFINKINKINDLPRDQSIYKTILENLLLPNELSLKIQNIKFILESDELKNKIVVENKNIKNIQSYPCSLDVSTDASQYSNHLKNTSKTTLTSYKKKETKTFNIDDSFHKNFFSKTNSFIQCESKKKKRVNFVDKLYNIPFADITLIQSYKKFNAGNNFMNKDEESDCKTRHSCCMLF